MRSQASPTGTPRCWICGEFADTREHRLKKADLVRGYGPGPYRAGSAPVRVRSGVILPVQGPGADVLKYSPSLCASCNNAATQPYDRAYDKFVTSVLTNEATVLKSRIIDMEQVFGEGWEAQQTDLYKYFVKSFGCRLVDAGSAAPADLVTTLHPESSFLTSLRIAFAVNEDVYDVFPAHVRQQYLGKGDLMGWNSPASGERITEFEWKENVSWLNVLYWYNREPHDAVGSILAANTQHLYLGSIANLTETEREDMRLKLQQSGLDEG